MREFVKLCALISINIEILNRLQAFLVSGWQRPSVCPWVDSIPVTKFSHIWWKMPFPKVRFEGLHLPSFWLLLLIMVEWRKVVFWQIGESWGLQGKRETHLKTNLIEMQFVVFRKFSLFNGWWSWVTVIVKKVYSWIKQLEIVWNFPDIFCE